MINYGFIEDVLDLTAYMRGEHRMPSIPYVENGDWTPWLPVYEPQARFFESSGCTVWGSLNCIETFMKRVYGVEQNYSERFTYLNVPITPDTGADPHKTCETIRTYGLINERDLPMTRTVARYLNRDDLTEAMYDKGERWLQQHEFRHEWLWNKRPANYIEVLKEALKTSPLGVSVTAWREVDGVFVSDNGGNNHFCMLFKIDDEGYPWIFDSYDHTIKKLSKDHNIRRAKRFWVNRRLVRDMKKHVSVLQSILNSLMIFKKKTLAQYCEEAIGTDVTPDDLIPDMVACAITVSTLINKTDPTFPKVAGTWTLWDILSHRSDYERVTTPTPETIVISPTGTGNGSIPGHVGIYLAGDVIASNDSQSGKFIKNYTLDTWKARYVTKGGFPVYYYKKKTI